MDEEVGVSVSEEEMIDSLFFRCDTHGEGKVHVYTVIQFLKNCLGNGNNEPDLLELAAILESDCTDGKINLSSYRQAVRQWVSEIRNRCESTSFLEPDGPLNSSYNLCNNSTDRSLCIETSGIGDGSFHKTEDDIGELLQNLEDLKFQNRKLGEEQIQLRNQLDTQEEVATNLTTELHNSNKEEEQLRKKIKSLQDLVDLRQSVMDENEELKTKLLSTQELKRDLDTKVVNLERENVNLESQVRNYESKWQKTCTELDLARKELQQLHNTCLEQKDLLLNVQETKSTQEEALTERNEELSALKERLNQLMEQNEKLQEEKEDVQVRLAQINGKLQRYQSKEEQQGLFDESLTGNNNGAERSKISPRLRFSTPLAKHSICMELKDRLNEDKNLPSPFCEKLELSTDVNYLNRRSVLLPTYMSAWDFEVSNGSLQDYSLELLKNRKSLSPGLYDEDLEKKLQSLKDLEKDGLQKEIVKLYRANLDLAEKCHKAELKEAELREVVNNTNYRHDLDKQKYLQLEDSLETSRVAREVDLKDLWRLVHNPDEEDSTESEISLSSSTEQLKDQIHREIEALRNKLNSKEKALTVLKHEKSKIHRGCNKRASNSPLVEALNIDLVKITKRQEFGRGEKCACQCDSKVHTCNRSVPLMRKHSREDNSEEQQCHHGDTKIDDSEHTNGEQSHIDKDILNESEELDNMHRQDIPERFKSESSVGSEGILQNSFDIDGVFKNTSPKYGKEDSGSGEKVYSSESQEWQVVKDEGIDFRKPHAENVTVHRDEAHAMLRRKSYRKAIENPASSADEGSTRRSRSDSFENAIEQGQVSPSRSTTAPVFTIGDSVIDTTPEYEGCDSLSLSTAPRFFSTPLSIDTVKAVQLDKKKSGNNNNDIDCKDVENRELNNLQAGPAQSEVKQQSTSLQTQLFKAGGLNPNKLSPCSSHHLSILLEEEANGDHDSLCSHSINSSPCSQPAKTNRSSESEKSPPSDFDFSAEIWTLSGSSEPPQNTLSSHDSGHSSSITSFERANISALKDSNTHSNQNSSKSSPISGPSVSHSTSISTSESPVSSVNYTSSYNASESPECDPYITNALTKEVFTASENICNIVKPVYQAACTHSVNNSESNGKMVVQTAVTKAEVTACTETDDVSCKSSSNIISDFENSESKSCIGSESKSQKGVSDENGNSMINPFSFKKKIDFRFVQSPKRQISSHSYESERNLSPSERILQRSAAKNLARSSETTQNITNHVHLPNRITPDLNSAECKVPPTDDTGSRNKKGLTLLTGSPVKDDGATSDSSEPPSPAICFFKVGENGLKNPNVVQNKHAVTNGVESSLGIVPEESAGHGGGDGHRFLVTSNLSKIREFHNHGGESQNATSSETYTNEMSTQKLMPPENHLAKRRDYIKQNKMPQLSELSEKDSPENNNEEKQIEAPVIKPKDDTPTLEMNGDVIMPSVPDEFLHKHGLTQDAKSSEELSDQEIESKFTSLSLAFKTDSQTLEKRLEIQERSRDIAEQNVDKELQGLRSGLETLNQICTDPQVREVLTKIQNHIDILEKSTARVSSRAEVFGAIQQEKRMSKAVDIMVHHVENIRRVHEREHAELEEARKLLQDSRSLAPSTIDLPGGGDMLSRRSASVCQNNMFAGKLSPQGGPTLNPLTPSTAKAIKLLKASRRRVSEIALPKVLGGTGAATLHPSASMDSFYTEPRSPRSPSLFRTGTDSSIDEDEGNMHTAHIDSESNSLRPPNFEADARSRFQAVIASTTVKTAVANTLRRASLEKQNHVQSVSPAITPQVSRDNSADSANKHIEVQDKEKQKNLEEEAFKKGYEQGMRASLGQDLSSLREQQNNINESLGEIMDSIDNQMEEPKSLKELLTERFHETVPKIKISGWRIRMTMGCFFIVMAILSVIVSLFPVGSASLVGYRHYGRPPL